MRGETARPEQVAGPPRVLFAALLVLASYAALRLAVFDAMRLDGLYLPHSETYWGRDFTNLYFGAKLLLERVEIYDVHSYREALRGFGITAWQNSSYPPAVYLIGVPLSFLPYGFALALWHLAGALLLIVAARPHIAFPWPFLFLVPAMMAVPHGQYGLIAAALWMFAFSGSGVAAGLLTIKPHLGLLLAPAMLARRRWRMIGTALAVALALLFAAEFAFGQTAAYLSHGVRAQMTVMLSKDDLFYFREMPSAYVWLRHTPFAWAAQALFAAIALILVWPLFRLPLASMVFPLATASFLILPYGFNYDMSVVFIGFAHFFWIGWGRRPPLELGALAAAMIAGAHVVAAPIFLTLGLYVERRMLLDGQAFKKGHER